MLRRSWKRAVLESGGGQTVTTGKSSSSIGRVVMDVEIGEFCQSEYDFPIKNPAATKLDITIMIQTNLPAFV